MARIKDKSVEKYGCLRYDEIPTRDWEVPSSWLPGLIKIATLTDGTYVIGPKENYQAWRKASEGLANKITR